MLFAYVRIEVRIELVIPTIKNLYIGDHPTYWMALGVPHDAYLGEFLMRTKAVIRD
ncbi:hypothetical protein [Microtetraspora sp. NBRC 16547]|uniref:hypothetical protein n=1 Tax=Microtetraspora sp. NBRC 16547 TaxID=3030993 RepID=UPI0024A2D1B6|nr:hypothetical protein [Microtetraspora sp. NBRC 16547]GLW96686.1 hypothetical protein Misp02_07730 [Microtetraspora sp. NBRC 16547]